MHKEVRKFCETIKFNFPVHFIDKRVLDCGSLDINGNNNYLFEGCDYTGIDIFEGKNVDIVCPVHEFKPRIPFDVVISTEMLEHDKYYDKSLKVMFSVLKPGGLLLITAASTGRSEHGTSDHHPKDSPLTHDYYRNITAEMITQAIDLSQFGWFILEYKGTDIRFAGIKL